MFSKPFPAGCQPIILGCSGDYLRNEEMAFFHEQQPYGFILFKRNIKNRQQVASLVASLKSCVNHAHVPILIDQEGGRVARLRQPEWKEYPRAASFLEEAGYDIVHAKDAVYRSYRDMAAMLSPLGINVNCAPVADISIAGAHDIIGDRAFGSTVSDIVLLADAAARGLSDGGITPIMKHIPGHGRALVDSHESLPVVTTDLKTLEKQDFAIFKQLTERGNNGWAMTAHIVYQAIDPTQPATLSKKVIGMIRDELGFDGVIISDDLSMHALSGSFAERAKHALAAGCDLLLHCNGDMEEMKQVVGSH